MKIAIKSIPLWTNAKLQMPVGLQYGTRPRLGNLSPIEVLTSIGEFFLDRGQKNAEIVLKFPDRGQDFTLLHFFFFWQLILNFGNFFLSYVDSWEN